MSQQAVTVQAGAPAWYGKLPGQGDFVGRRLPHQVRSGWDAWLGAGLEQLRQVAPADWTGRFVQSPLWCFLAGPAVGGIAMCGMLAASTDRVGRCYPISVMALARPQEQGLARGRAAAQFLSGTRDAIVEARRHGWSAEQLDARLAVLPWPFGRNGEAAPQADQAVDALLDDLERSGVGGDGVSLPDAARWASLQAGGALSVWWPATAAGAPVLQHCGAPDAGLFARLFRGQGA